MSIFITEVGPCDWAIRSTSRMICLRTIRQQRPAGWRDCLDQDDRLQSTGTLEDQGRTPPQGGGCPPRREERRIFPRLRQARPPASAQAMIARGACRGSGKYLVEAVGLRTCKTRG